MTTPALILALVVLGFLLNERVQKRRADERVKRFLRSPRPPPKTKLS